MLIYVRIVHLYFMLPTFSDWWPKYTHTANCTGAVSPSQKFNLYTTANKSQ